MKIAIIGGGNMGGSIARGLATIEDYQITVSDPSERTLDGLRRDCPSVVLTNDNRAAVAGADIVIVAVKPWLVDPVLTAMRSSLDLTKQLFVCIAAGVEFSALTSILGEGSYPLFRAIPNTAIAIRQSPTLLSAYRASDDATGIVKGIFDALGTAIVIDERLMAAGTAVTSCGIAYAFQYVKAAIQGAIELGFYPHVAKEMIDQTVVGAIQLMETNGSTPDEEIYKVCTPGGITIKGLNEMAAKGFDDAVISGLRKAAGR